MTSSKLVSLMFLLCAIEAAALPTEDCTLYVPNEEDAKKGSVATLLCGISKRKVMEENGREQNNEGNSTKIVNSEGAKEKKAEKEADRKTEVINGSHNSMKNNEKLDQKPKVFKDGKPPEVAVMPKTKAKKSLCNGRSKKCKVKRLRPKKSKKQHNRRRRVAKTRRNRRH